MISPFVVLGGAPQDLSYRGEPTRLEIGEHREQCESLPRRLMFGRDDESAGGDFLAAPPLDLEAADVPQQLLATQSSHFDPRGRGSHSRPWSPS